MQPVEFSQVGSDRPDQDRSSGKFTVRLYDARATGAVELRKNQKR